MNNAEPLAFSSCPSCSHTVPLAPGLSDVCAIRCPRFAIDRNSFSTLTAVAGTGRETGPPLQLPLVCNWLERQVLRCPTLPRLMTSSVVVIVVVVIVMEVIVV